MSASALKAVATGQQPATKTDDKVAKFINSLVPQMKRAIPTHLNSDRMARIVLTEMRRVPKLQQCETASLAGCIMTCAQLGLEPGNGLGHAYLLPYDNRKAGTTECQLIIGYRGMIDLARRSGQIISINAYVVHQKDEFSFALGLAPDVQHIPTDEEDCGTLTHVYAVAKLKDGGTQFEVMSRKQVEAIRSRSRAGQSGPWVTDFEEMAKKTVIRRLFKYLPVSVEMQRAVIIDERVDAGLPQSEVFDGEYQTMPAAEDTAPTVDDLKHMIANGEAELALTMMAHLPAEQQAELEALVPVTA